MEKTHLYLLPHQHGFSLPSTLRANTSIYTSNQRETCYLWSGQSLGVQQGWALLQQTHCLMTRLLFHGEKRKKKKKEKVKIQYLKLVWTLRFITFWCYLEQKPGNLFWSLAAATHTVFHLSQPGSLPLLMDGDPFTVYVLDCKGRWIT